MKKKISTYVIFVSLLCMKLTGCSPIMYSNIGQNVPMFTEKGEVAAQVAIASSGSDGMAYANGIALNAATAVTDKWSAIMSFYSMNNKEEPSADEWDTKGSYFELGAGRYGRLGRKWFAYEITGGLGFGGIKNDGGGNKVHVNYIKPFIQPSIGFITPYGDIILTPRIAYVGYTNKDVVTNQPELRQQTDYFFEEQSSSIVFEPGLTVRGGFKNVKLQAQWNWSTFRQDYGELYPVNNQYVSLGVFILFSNRYKKD